MKKLVVSSKLHFQRLQMSPFSSNSALFALHPKDLVYTPGRAHLSLPHLIWSSQEKLSADGKEQSIAPDPLLSGSMIPAVHPGIE